MDAIAKAESLADAAGVRLGPISRIDHSDGGHRPIMYSRAMNSDYVPESVEFSDSVTMEWVIA